MRLTGLLLGLALAGAVTATEVQESRTDAQARELARELRCTVCQSETVWESNSTLAQQMRQLIRERLAKGESPAEVKQYLYQRYGDYILMKPRFSGAHVWLWLLPLLLLSAGAFALWRTLRRWKKPAAPAPAPLTPQMRARIADELQRDGDEQ